MYKCRSAKRASYLSFLATILFIAATPSAALTPAERSAAESKLQQMNSLLTNINADMNSKKLEMERAKIACNKVLETRYSLLNPDYSVAKLKRLLGGKSVAASTEVDTKDTVCAQAKKGQIWFMGKQNSPDITKAWTDYETAHALFKTKRDLYIAAQIEYVSLSQKVSLWAANNLDKVPLDTKSNGGTCSLDSAPERRKIANDINGCVALAPSGNTPPQLGAALPSRFLDRRGISTEVAVTKSGANAALKWNDTTKFVRSGYLRQSQNKALAGENTRRSGFRAYSIGIESKIDTDTNRARLVGKSSKDDLFDLDRLDANFKVTGSYSFNYFPREKESEFDVRAKELFEAARKACRKDVAESSPATPLGCTGLELVQWIFTAKKDGTYAHPKIVKMFDKVYWGSKRALPQFGYGLSGSIARPERSYDLISDQDGKLDLALVQPSFFTDDPKTKNKWIFSAKAFAYFHDYPDKYQNINEGTTFIPSLAFKRDFQSLDEVEICTAQNAGTSFDSSKTCRSTLPFEPKLRSTWIPSFEIRQAFKGTRVLPKISIGPTFSYDTDEKKFVAELPVWFGLGDGDLSAGVVLAREWDRKKKTSDTGIHLFLGKTFSLSGKD